MPEDDIAHIIAAVLDIENGIGRDRVEHIVLVPQQLPVGWIERAGWRCRCGRADVYLVCGLSVDDSAISHHSEGADRVCSGGAVKCGVQINTISSVVSRCWIIRRRIGELLREIELLRELFHELLLSPLFD